MLRRLNRQTIGKWAPWVIVAVLMAGVVFFAMPRSELLAPGRLNSLPVPGAVAPAAPNTSIQTFQNAPAAPPAAPRPAATPAAASAGSGANLASGQNPNAIRNAANLDRKIIRNATLALTIRDVNAAADEATTLAQRRGGWVAATQVQEIGNGRTTANLTIKVPVDEFEPLMRELRQLGQLNSERITSQDVTDEFEDVQAQVKTLELLEDSYQEGKKVWNRDMTVDPEAIKLVLEQSTVAGAANLDPKRFFDNTLIKEVNRDYASKLFPGQVK